MGGGTTSGSGGGATRVDVVVLCGSSGSRLFPLTIGSPKCLLPVANVPVLALLLASLARLGFADALLVTTAVRQ